MKTIREPGEVESVKGGKAVVLVTAEMHDGCASCRMCAMGDGGIHRLEVETEERLEAGDKVVVELVLPSAYWGVLMLFVLPLVGLVIGGLAGQWIGKAAQMDRSANTLALVCGAAGFAAGLAVGFMHERRLKKQLPAPRIVEVSRKGS